MGIRQQVDLHLAHGDDAFHVRQCAQLGDVAVGEETAREFDVGKAGAIPQITLVEDAEIARVAAPSQAVQHTQRADGRAEKHQRRHERRA